jgi:choline kinase
MKAVILAAGRGSRMGTLTDEHPKCMTILHGKTLLYWQLKALRGAGIREIAIVRGYLGDTFDLELTYFENPRWSETNMVMSLVQADEWLKDDACVVSYSDIVYSENAVQRLVETNENIGITYDPNWLQLWQARFDEPLSDAESFAINSNGYLIEVGNRTQSLSQVQGQYMGLLLFSPVGWEVTKKLISQHTELEKNKMDVTMLLQKLINQGEKIKTVAINDPWYEVDSESDLAYYESLTSLKLGETFKNLS